MVILINNCSSKRYKFTGNNNSESVKKVQISLTTISNRNVTISSMFEKSSLIFKLIYEIKKSCCCLLIITHLFLGCKGIKNLRFLSKKSSKVYEKICDSFRKNLQILKNKSAISGQNASKIGIIAVNDDEKKMHLFT